MRSTEDTSTGPELNPGSDGRSTPSPRDRSPQVSRLEAIRSNLQNQGFPQPVVELLIAANRPTTRKAYESAWRNWSNWCLRQNTDPLSVDLGNILSFLAELNTKGLLQLTPTSSEISFNLGSRPSFIFRGVNLLNAGEVSHRKIGHSPGSGHTDASLGISVNQPLINPNFGYRSKVCTSTSKEKPTSGPVGDIHAKKTH